MSKRKNWKTYSYQIEDTFIKSYEWFQTSLYRVSTTSIFVQACSNRRQLPNSSHLLVNYQRFNPRRWREIQTWFCLGCLITTLTTRLLPWLISFTLPSLLKSQLYCSITVFSWLMVWSNHRTRWVTKQWQHCCLNIITVLSERSCNICSAGVWKHFHKLIHKIWWYIVWLGSIWYISRVWRWLFNISGSIEQRCRLTCCVFFCRNVN